MRYTVTFEVDINATNDKHALSKAELIARNQSNCFPQDWMVTELHETPFASFNVRKVDIHKIRTEELVKSLEDDSLPF